MPIKKMEFHTKMAERIFITIIVLFGLSSCTKSDNGLDENDVKMENLAMRPSMIIEATNKNGSVEIEYISILERKFDWGEGEEIRKLWPRPREFYGQRGSYDPASKFVWEFWKPSPRIVSSDSTLEVGSEENMYAKLYEGSAVFDWVYNDTGLVVGFAKQEMRGRQVNVIVNQLLINGEKPNGIKGSRPNQLKITFR